MSNANKAEPKRPYGLKPALLTYLNDLKPDAQERFADKCGTTKGQLRQIAHGNRPCKAQTAVLIDRHSRGLVSYADMCPDLDWPYVAETVRKRTNERAKDSVRPSQSDS